MALRSFVLIHGEEGGGGGGLSRAGRADPAWVCLVPRAVRVRRRQSSHRSGGGCDGNRREYVVDPWTQAWRP